MAGAALAAGLAGVALIGLLIGLLTGPDKMLPGDLIFALGDAVIAQNFARELQKEGIYVTGFFFPVVPKGQARIRTQMSAAHTPEQIERAVEAFTRIGKQLGVIA